MRRHTICRRLRFEPLEERRVLAAAFAEFIDPNPADGNQFGARVVPLATGNVVITAPFDDAGGEDAGAVYLFNGRTGELISTLQGSHANDQIGSGWLTALTNGNFVIASPNWDSDTTVDVGAVTWGSGVTGVSGIVSAENSLVGSTANDKISFNTSLVSNVIALTNGNYVVASRYWDNGGIVDAGAATFGDGSVGVRGEISAANSLVGTGSGDQVGSSGASALKNGNYVVESRTWNGTRGAATFGNGITGVRGAVSAENSLVGSQSGDEVGIAVALPNGNYAVKSSTWSDGNVRMVGAITFGNGVTGISGPVSVENSLIGSSTQDFVGADNAINVLANGNYVVAATHWDNGAADDAGAVTLGSGTTGVSGRISSGNSLVGTATDDQVGRFIVPLANGNYVVSSPKWNDGAKLDVGAVTFGNGVSGIVGTISASNSLIGSTAGDEVGTGTRALSNGHYAVVSPLWDHVTVENGTIQNVGAVTWGDGNLGIRGAVSTANSLVGEKAGDHVGGVPDQFGRYSAGIVALTNGDLEIGSYVVSSPQWDNGSVADAGAVTFFSGTGPTIGVVSANNSLVGGSPGDQIGSRAVTALRNGNYVVSSPLWDNGTTSDVGATTFGNGQTGTTGLVSATNSLVGSTTNDQQTTGVVVRPLANGSYVVSGPAWDLGDIVDVGAATFGSGAVGVSGVIGPTISLIGDSAGDQITGFGSTVSALDNGNYVVVTRTWDSGNLADAGAVTFGDGILGIRGPINETNSLIGGSANSNLQSLAFDDINQHFYATFRDEGGGRVRVGSKIDGFSHPWHLAVTPLDVNNDGTVAPNDSLAIINYINAFGAGAVPASATLGRPHGFLDTTGDDFVAPDDVLDIINAINAGQTGEGEGVQQIGDRPASEAEGETGAPDVDEGLITLLALDTFWQHRRRK